MNASGLDEMKKESPEAFKEHLEKCRLKMVMMRLKSEARENPKSGDIVLRHNVASLRPLNFKEEISRLFHYINLYSSGLRD